MAATARLGSASRNTGSEDAVWTGAISVGEVVSVVMSRAAATSFIHMQVLDASQTSHSMRNVGYLSGAQGDVFAAVVASGETRFSLMDMRVSPDAAALRRARIALPAAHPHVALLVAQLGDRTRNGGPRDAGHARLHSLAGRGRRDAAVRVAGPASALAGDRARLEGGRVAGILGHGPAQPLRLLRPAIHHRY